jgi:MFS family permease
MGPSSSESGPGGVPSDRRYVTFLVIIALSGWTLASYDFNLLVVALPDISKDLHLTASFVGLLGFIIYAAMFGITLFAGYGMDRLGRKKMWMWCLSGAALFTGLTYFVENYWQLAVVRALASGFATSELAISITLVNEQVPAERRGLLYSVVQGGWPLGLFLASGVYLLSQHLGWRTAFLFGVIPIIAVIIGRIWVKESDRFLHLQEVKRASAAGDQTRVNVLLERYAVNVAEVGKVTVRQLFATPGFVRRRLGLLTLVWLFYTSSWVATNVYITYWLVHYNQWTSAEAGRLLLICGGLGFFFYILGGLLGERWGRREVLVWTGLATGPLNLLFMFVHQPVSVWIVYFLIYQLTNGAWSGAGYAYWAESFPTRVRGTAIGWLGAMCALGLILGTLLWTILISMTSPAVTWFVIAVVLGFGQWTTLLLPRIKPGQELEAVAT